MSCVRFPGTPISEPAPCPLIPCSLPEAHTLTGFALTVAISEQSLDISIITPLEYMSVHQMLLALCSVMSWAHVLNDFRIHHCTY